MQQEVLVSPSKAGRFTKTLLETLKDQVSEGLAAQRLDFNTVRVEGEYITIRTDNPVEVAQTVSQYPGVEYAAVVEKTSDRIQDVTNLLDKVGKRIVYPGETFRVSVNIRGGKNYKPRDIEVLATARLVGDLSEINARPDEAKAKKTVYAEIDGRRCYVYSFKYVGVGGLPTGSSGKAVCLLEDGFGSLIACWLAQRIGFEPHYLLVDFGEDWSQRNLPKFLRALTKMRRTLPVKKVNLSMVDVRRYIRTLVGGHPVSVRSILAHRFAVRLGSELAYKTGAGFLVSSMSLSNMSPNVIAFLSEPTASHSQTILFPAVALTEREFGMYAEMFGLQNVTFPKGRMSTMSAESVAECFEKVRVAESRLDVERLVKEALEHVKTVPLDLETEVHGLLRILR